MSDDFDWSVTNGDVILAEQRTTAVYTNKWGQAVIRQERGAMEDEDTYVIIDHANIPAVIMALRDIGDQPINRQPQEDDERKP